MNVLLANHQRDLNAFSKKYKAHLESNTLDCKKQVKYKLEQLNKVHHAEIEILKIEYGHILVAKKNSHKKIRT